MTMAAFLIIGGYEIPRDIAIYELFPRIPREDLARMIIAYCGHDQNNIDARTLIKTFLYERETLRMKKTYDICMTDKLFGGDKWWCWGEIYRTEFTALLNERNIHGLRIVLGLKKPKYRYILSVLIISSIIKRVFSTTIISYNNFDEYYNDVTGNHRVFNSAYYECVKEQFGKIWDMIFDTRFEPGQKIDNTSQLAEEMRNVLITYYQLAYGIYREMWLSIPPDDPIYEYFHIECVTRELKIYLNKLVLRS